MKRLKDKVEKNLIATEEVWKDRNRKENTEIKDESRICIPEKREDKNFKTEGYKSQDVKGLPSAQDNE